MIKRLVFLFLAILFVLIGATAPVLAQDNLRSKEIVVLEKNEVINKDFFASGEKIVLSGTVNGDAYLAGGNITVEGVVNGDLLVAGGNISINGKVTGDVRTLGGNINISGTVLGNITALGGSISLNDNAQIKGSLVAGGGNIQVYAPIGKGATIAAGSLTLGNSLGGSSLFTGRDITLTSKAKVSGDLIYFSQKQADIQSGASISGTISHQFSPQKFDQQKVAGALTTLKSGFIIFNFLSTLIVGLILIWLSPNLIKSTAQTINSRPWQALGVGLLIIILMPITVGLLLVTVLGIPLALILMGLYLLELYLSHIITAVFLGQKAAVILNQKVNLYLILLLGLLVLTVLTLIPFIGWLISFISLSLGVGAIVVTKYSFYQSVRSKNLV